MYTVEQAKEIVIKRKWKITSHGCEFIINGDGYFLIRCLYNKNDPYYFFYCESEGVVHYLYDDHDDTKAITDVMSILSDMQITNNSE